MKRILALAILFTAAAVAVLGQTVTLTSSRFADSAGNLYTGIVTFAPVINGNPTAYRTASGGVVTPVPVSVYAMAGVFSLTLPDTTTTVPANICFKMVAGTLTGFAPGYACLQPHTIATGVTDWCQAGVCNLDNYSPTFPVLAPVWGVSSINAVMGPLSFFGPGVTQTGNSFYFPGGGSGSVGDSDVTGQTASQSTVNLVGTVPASGKYLIGYYLDQNAVCASGSVSVTLTFSWTDASHARIVQSIPLSLGSSQLNSGSIQGAIRIYAVISSAITYTSTVTGSCATGGPASYDAHIAVEEVQ